MTFTAIDWQEDKINFYDMTVEFREHLLTYIVHECEWARVMLDKSVPTINGQTIDGYEYKIPYTDIRLVFVLNWCVGGISQVFAHNTKSGLGTIISFGFKNSGEVFIVQTSVDLGTLINGLKLFDLFKSDIYNRIEGE